MEWPSSACCALTFLRIEPGQDLLASVRAFRDETQNLGGAQWVYAGKSIITGNVSSQIGPVDWNAVVLAQYPSREAYDDAAASERYRGALAAFAQTYIRGFNRPAMLNLFIHQFLLAKRARQIMTFAPSLFPLQRDESVGASPEAEEGARRLLAVPGAPVIETKGGHFLQEEVPIEIAAALSRVIDRIQRPGMARP